MENEVSYGVELVRQGEVDPQVLGMVWEHYRAQLLRLVRLRMDRRLQGLVDPSDVLQEAFVDFAGRVDGAAYGDIPLCRRGLSKLGGIWIGHSAGRVPRSGRRRFFTAG